LFLLKSSPWTYDPLYLPPKSHFDVPSAGQVEYAPIYCAQPILDFESKAMIHSQYTFYFIFNLVVFLLNLKLTSIQRTSSKSTIATTLYTSAPSIEYTSRIAKILARRFSIPVYVGCSIDPHGLGLEVAEEMEGLTKIINVIMEKWEEHKKEKPTE
jgi:hypothetical protein